MTETKKDTTSQETKATGKTTKIAKPALPKTSKEEAIKKHQQMMQFVQNVLSEMESDIKRMHLVLNHLTKFDPENPETREEINKGDTKTQQEELKTYNEENTQIIEGKFDGYFMI